MRKPILMGLAVLLAAACARENVPGPLEEQDRKAETKAGEKIEITATLSDLGLLETRVSLSKKENGGLKTAWVPGDEIRVGGEVFTLVSAEGAKGRFSGKAPSGERFDIVYSAPEGETVQQQSDDTGHLRFSASLSGVDSYQDIRFNHGWAAEHGGSFSQSAFLQLVLNLPAAATSLSAVQFEGEGLPTLQLTVDEKAPVSGPFIAWMPMGEDPLSLSSDKMVTLTIQAGGDQYINSFYPAPQILYGGCVVRLVTSASKWSRELSGKGSESDPYLIGSVEDFQNIRNLIAENTYTYFRQSADLDFSAVENWTPINPVNAAFGIMYDGQGHQIKNFSCKASTWASLFGVLHGEVKNLTLTDASVVTSGTSPCGVVAAWVGNSDGSLQGRLENVHVQNGRIACGGNAYFGGLVGRSSQSSFVNCSFDGSVERTVAAAAGDPTYFPVGGILGNALEGCSFTGCMSSGTLTTASGRAAGGIVGKCDAEAAIQDCRSTMTINARDDVAGGIVGYYVSGTISGCRVQAPITVTANVSTANASYIGGIAGHSAGSAIITRCAYEGALSGAAGIIGGILGQSNASTGSGTVISECHAKGTIKGTNVIGGIIGRSSNQGLTVDHCASEMDITASSSYIGGILGDAGKNTVVSHCYARGAVKGSFALGGIVGRAYGRQGSSNSLDTDVNTSVVECIAFNSSIKTITAGGENPSSHYSGGAVVGCSSRPNTLKNCWRSATMEFQFYSDAALNVLFDHADSSPTTPLVQPAGSAKWFSPYHGKAAASDATISSVGQLLSWDSSIWDLSQAVPVLKNLPK